jgi:hypothetical protein
MDKIVILADLGKLVAYRIMTDPDGIASPRAEMIKCMDCLEAHTKTSDRVSDSAGRFRRAGKTENGIRAGYGDRHNMQTETRRRLVKIAAGEISSLLIEEGSPPWHLAASRAINRSLLESLPPDLMAKLRKNLKADLTNLRKSDVLSRFLN